MLSKIAKLIGVGAIIGLSGLSTWGSDDYEIWDGNGSIPTGNVMIEYDETGKIQKIVILDFKENPGETPIVVYEEDESKENYGEPIGLKLNLPEELIQDCEDEHWKIHDEKLKQELEIVVATEQSFHAWCDKQEDTEYNLLKTRNLCRSCAYTLKIANEKNYLIPGDFCKRIELHSILEHIHLKGSLCCGKGFPAMTPAEKYIKDLYWDILNFEENITQENDF